MTDPGFAVVPGGLAGAGRMAGVGHYFTETTNQTFRRAREEAAKRGSRVTAAEHLLLALAATPTSPSGRILIELGLGREHLEAALREERRRSLAYAGVEPPSRPLTTVRRGGEMRLSASARAAIQRGAAIGHQRHRVRVGTDLLLGLIQAELGTVPRVLAIAGVSPHAIAARIAAHEHAEYGTGYLPAPPTL